MQYLMQRLDIELLLTQMVGFLPRLLAALMVMLVFWVVFRLTCKPLRAIFRRIGYHETLIHMIVDNVYRVAVLILGLIMAADQVGVNVGAALAGIGVVGLAIGFAAQDSLANIIAGFLIFWDKPFEVADWVSVAGQYGEVKGITMRTTRIRTRNNTYVVIPNKTIIDEVLVNHSKHGETRVDVPIGIAYKEHIPKARAVLVQALKTIEGVAEQPAPEVVVTELAASGVNMEARVWIENASSEQPVYFQVLEACKLALDAAGIEIPYHHLQLFIEKVEDRVWAKAETLLLAGRADSGSPGIEDR